MARNKDKPRNELDKAKAKLGYNPMLLARIQPAGNLSCKDAKYIQTGDGYITCLQVYSYPDVTYDFWLHKLTGINGVVTTADIATKDKNEAEADIIRSLDELQQRYNTEKDYGSAIDDGSDFRLLHDLLHSIKREGETLKFLIVRIYISARTLKEIEDKTQAVITNIESDDYRAAVFLNETEYQYRAMFTPYRMQAQQPNRRIGNPVPALALAGGYPFNGEQLDDPYGQYIGSTAAGGLVIFDPFHKTKMRLSYDALLVGKKGSGKSTALKMMLVNAAIAGNWVRAIDKAGEFTTIGETMDAHVLFMDGSQGIVNVLQAFRVSESEDVNFAAHLSKLNTFYKFIKPSADADERNEFEECVRRVYESRGLWEPGKTGQKITGLDNRLYPTFRDLLQTIQEELYVDIAARELRNLSPSRVKRLESIELSIGNLVHSYPHLFCGTTSIPDLDEKKIVVYNVAGLSNMKEEIANALLFNILNMMLDDMIRVGAPAKQAFEAGTPIRDIPKLMLMIDEAHAFINTKNTLVLDYMIDIVRESRKYFTGLWFASQSIRDFAPDATGDGVDKLKTLFELVPYKFIMQQDSNSLDLLRKILQQDITESQLQQIPKLPLGESFFLDNESAMHIYFEPTQQELDLFKGGA